MEPIEFEIGIVEYRSIIKSIKDLYNYDYSDYALTSLKKRIERVIILHGLKNSELLIDRLREDSAFFQQFLRETAVESTEMFRDPSMWRYLRDQLLPQLANNNYKPKVWFPSNVSGDELFSFLILLKEQGWSDSFEVYATYFNEVSLEQIKKGFLKGSKIEVSNENYTRFQGKSRLFDYYTLKNDYALRDTSLIKNVQFVKQNINFDSSPQDIKLVIFRNQLIYYNQNLHDRVLKLFYDLSNTGSYLILGAKEITGSISAKYYKLINEEDSIYKKI